VHILLELPSTRSIQEVARLFKGESSYWIHANNLVNYNFKWQRGYGAFSVGFSQLNTVKNYIANQDTHHNAKSFNQEYEE
jgi:REP element-mobilizing transposase RayT